MAVGYIMKVATPDIHVVPFPFVRDTRWEDDGDESGRGGTEVPSWKPGTRREDNGEDRLDNLADGVGAVEYEMVGRYKPGKGYPERVFYTRTWIDPDGTRFRKRRLLVTTAGNFTRMLKGYRYHFDMARQSVA